MSSLLDGGLCHFSTVHPRHDTRIRLKEVATLAECYGSVTLVVQDGLGDEVEDAGRVIIRDIGLAGGRLRRALQGGWRMWRMARQIRPLVSHFHDPELLLVALALKLTGSTVIYDAHEDLPRQILSKRWIASWLRRPIAALAAAAMWFAGRALDSIVAATPSIADRFPKRKTTTVQNFPLLNELRKPHDREVAERLATAVYVGVITEMRGAREMVQAIDRVPGRHRLRLAMAGTFMPHALAKDLAAEPGWAKTEVMGFLGRPDLARLLNDARMGLVLFHPAPNHIDAQPNKLFEYMSAGIPVIASDFPLWRKIVDEAGCGLLVDPLDPEAIAEAMCWVMDHPEEAEDMGRCGREAVEQQYHWQPEAEKLLALYDKLLAPHHSRVRVQE